MSQYSEIKATLESPGMVIILNALRAYHKSQWREYRNCKTDVDLAKIQTAQLMIDKVIPGILTRLMNDHIPESDKEKAKKSREWWDWRTWFDAVKYKSS